MDRTGAASNEPAGRDLLERDVELAQIGELVARSRRGEGELVVIAGDAGIGKTRLLAAVQAHAADEGVRVLAATGGELERDLAYGVVRQLFEAPLRRLGSARRRHMLSGAASFASPVVEPPPGAGWTSMQGDRSGAVMHGLYWLTANLAEEAPLVIVIDDAHWMDVPSAKWVLYLARRLGDLPITAVLALRSGEERAAPLTGLDEGLRAHRFELRPLTAAATESMVRGVFGVEADAEFCEACHGVTGGNPFLVGELLSALASDRVEPIAANAPGVGEIAPDSVARSVLTRLMRVGDDAVALAQAAAVLGSRAELRHAAALGGLEIVDAVRAADALARIEVLEPVRPLRFAHPLVQNAIYAAIAPGERSLKHAAAARLLVAENARPGRVAAHVLHAEPAGDEWVVSTLREAAREASAQGAPEQAAEYLRRALNEPPSAGHRAAVLHELGAAELLARDPAATDHLAQALAATDDPGARGGTALLLGRAAVSTGRLADARGLLGPVIEQLGGAQPGVVARLEAYRSASGVWDPQFADELTRELPGLRSLAERGGAAGRSLLLMLAFRLAFEGGPRGEIVALVERGFDHGRLIESESAEAIEVTWAARALTFIDELEQADPLVDQMVVDSRERGSVMGYATASAWRADIALHRGLIASAEADASLAIDLASTYGLYFIAPHVHSFLGEALIERGQMKLAAELLERADLGPMHGSRPEVRFLHTRARISLARQDNQAAIADLRTCQRQAPWFFNPNVLPWRSTLALALADSAHDEAISLAQAELDLARRIGQPRAIGIALRAQALLSEGDTQIELLREAIAALNASPSLLEQARASTDLGAALRRSGRRTDAREPLRRGLDLAAASGSSALAARARDELVAAGARPRRQRIAGQEGLTASERRVAEMAAAGMSNRQIAQALFVTMKTVATHLTHTYQKLNVTSRTQLRDALNEDSKDDRASLAPPPAGSASIKDLSTRQLP